MYSACCCCALSMVENESRNIFFDVFPMFQIEFRLDRLSLFNLKKKKKKLKKRKRWWGRHELAIVHKSNPVCVTIGRSVILCCAWFFFFAVARALLFLSFGIFFFCSFEGVAFNIITLRGLVGIYTIKLSVKRGKDKGGGLMERHRPRATLFIRWCMMGGKVWNEEGRAGWQQNPFAGSLTSCCVL